MGANTDQKWSAARTRKMTRLADQGMSTSQIADALGLTRNQVLGKISPRPQDKESTSTGVAEEVAEHTSGQKVDEAGQPTIIGRANRESARANPRPS